jgi:hypothetical protein
MHAYAAAHAQQLRMQRRFGYAGLVTAQGSGTMLKVSSGLQNINGSSSEIPSSFPSRNSPSGT